MSTSLLAPSLLLSILVSVGLASLFHLWRGRTMADLVLFLLAAAIGFGVGQLAGTVVRIPLAQVGEIHVIEASIGALLALALANMVTSPAGRRR
jgi:hypothetical protein